MRDLAKLVVVGVLLLALTSCAVSGIISENITSSAPTLQLVPSAQPTAKNAEAAAKKPSAEHIGIMDSAKIDAVFFRVKDLKDGGAGLGENQKFLKIRPETVIPPYYAELSGIFFPSELAMSGTDRQTEIQEIALDSSGIRDYTGLISKIRESAGNLLDGYVLLQEETDVFEAQNHLTQAEIDTRAQNGSISLFFFRQSVFGIAIDSPGGDEGELTIRRRADKLTIPQNEIRAFVPHGDEYIQAMPLDDALSIAENTRTTESAVRIAQLVYTSIPDVFDDDNYHLCWRIVASSTYYIGCVNGEKWCADKSE